MKAHFKYLLLAGALFMTASVAQAQQDCILEGTVDKNKAEQAGKNVYVAFHSASSAGEAGSCRLNRRSKLEFKEPKNAMIENAPHGAKVKYRYTEDEGEAAQWRLISVGMD